MSIGLDWTLPYASQRSPVLARNMVATTQPLAAQAGLRMLQRGGNAADAAIAAAIALTVVEPVSSGIGCDAFALLCDGGRVHALNATGRTPKKWRARYREKGIGVNEVWGWESVTTPGAVSAWVALSQKHGRLPFSVLFEPAIEYARNGFHVSPNIARMWKGLYRVYQDYPEVLNAFFPGGKAPEPGDVFRFPEQADTFEAIAATMGETFYRGEIAHQIAAHAMAASADLSLDDLASHTADWVEPLSISYRGVTVHEMPPNSQGLAALISLGILENFEMAKYPVDSAESIHLQIEATKLAFADVSMHVGDPRSMSRHPEEFLDQTYLRQRAG